MNVLPSHLHSQELSSVSNITACPESPGLGPSPLGENPTLHSPPAQGQRDKSLLVPQAGVKPPTRDKRREMLLLSGFKKEKREREGEFK